MWQRTAHVALTQELAAVAMGHRPAELIITGGTLLNVNTGELLPDTDVAVYGGHIALVGNATHVLRDEQTVVVEAGGRFLVPGFIDTHLHVESSMVDVPRYAEAVLPRGTTAIVPDPHEIANVFGLEGVKLFVQSAENLPLKVLTMMPSCVPSIPGFEDGGAVFTDKEVAEAAAWPGIYGLGEMMNFPGVIFGDPGVHAIMQAVERTGKIVTGHHSHPDIARGLNAFVAAGITACHEATTKQEALQRARFGCYAQQRYGTAWLDMPNTIQAVLENPALDTRFFTLVSDDVTPETLQHDGHMDRLVRKAIELGVKPVVAYQMATINAAQLMNAWRSIGTISPGRSADILIISDLEQVTIDAVYCDGRLVAEEGQLKVEIPAFAYPDWSLKSVHLAELSADDFAVPVAATGDTVAVRVIRAYEGRVDTSEETVALRLVDGAVQASVESDVAKLAVFERHHNTGSRGLGFVTGFGLQKGAVASTVAHDSHNLMVMGVRDDDMALAANELIRLGGGMTVVADGQVLASVPLPLAGLMSLDAVPVVAEQVRALEEAWRAIGCAWVGPEMTFSLLALIVLSELHLSNRSDFGYVKLNPAPEIVPLLVEAD
jgi:adenine deaminase